MPEIVLDNVSKKFGETVAADGLSLRMNKIKSNKVQR